MRRTLIIGVLTMLVGCGPQDPYDDPAGRSDTRQQPTNLTPGVNLSGYANIGIKRRF